MGHGEETLICHHREPKDGSGPRRDWQRGSEGGNPKSLAKGLGRGQVPLSFLPLPSEEEESPALEPRTGR